MNLKEIIYGSNFIAMINSFVCYLLNYIILNTKLFFKNSLIYPGARIYGASRLKIGHNVVIRENSYIIIPQEGFINIGKNVFIGIFCIMDGRGGITIGNNVALAPRVSIYAQMHNHNITGKPFCQQGFTAKGVKIEDDVWVGANSIILDGVTIGQGAVIGAGSVVTGDVPKFAVAVGIPARVIKFRKENG